MHLQLVLCSSRIAARELLQCMILLLCVCVCVSVDCTLVYSGTAYIIPTQYFLAMYCSVDKKRCCGNTFYEL
jgi:hypothetical protein